MKCSSTRSKAVSICIISLAVLAVLPVCVYADDPIESIQYTYQNLTDLEAQFTQSTSVEALGKTVSNRGTLMLRKPGMLRLEYTGNPQRHYISDGKRLWVYTPGDNQYQVFAIGGQAVPRDALTFLNGFGNLRKTFAAEQYTPVKAEANHVYLRLKPRARASYRQLDCDFDGRHLLAGLTIFNASGNQTRYAFTGIKINPGIASSLFSFKPPAGARETSVEK